MSETYDVDIEKSNLTSTIQKAKSVEELQNILKKYIGPRQQKEADSITQLRKEIERCQKRTMRVVLEDHKKLIGAGGLVTGFNDIDEKLVFQKSDLVVIQGMSNHGKSSLMLNLNYRFLTHKENVDQQPLCIFMTYESHPLRIEEKFLNIMTKDMEKKLLMKMDRRANIDLLSSQSRYGNYLYLSEDSVKKSVELYDSLITNNRLMIMGKQPLKVCPI